MDRGAGHEEANGLRTADRQRTEFRESKIPSVRSCIAPIPICDIDRIRRLTLLAEHRLQHSALPHAYMNVSLTRIDCL